MNNKILETEQHDPKVLMTYVFILRRFEARPLDPARSSLGHCLFWPLRAQEGEGGLLVTNPKAP
jgi:hypothetical protein